MRVLVVIPHSTLLTPSGHRGRLDGVLKLLRDEEVSFLIPKSTPPQHLKGLPGKRFYYFPEPRFFSQDVPFFIDFSKKFRDAIEDAVVQSAACIVIFSFPWGLLRTSLRLTVPTLYLSHGVEKMFARVTLRHAGFDYFPLNYLFPKYVEYLEWLAGRRAKAIACMSPNDAEWYVKNYRLKPERVFPLGQPAHIAKPLLSRQEARIKFNLSQEAILVVFHGSFDHLPNREAMSSIVNEIAPFVRAERRDVQFIIAGGGKESYAQEGVNFLGFVDDLESLIACCDVAIMPIYSGAGVRVKTFDYFSLGVPIVSTKKGVEGLELEFDREAIISNNSARSIADALLILLSQPEKMEQLRRAGYRYLLEKCDEEKLRTFFKHRIQKAAGA